MAKKKILIVDDDPDVRQRMQLVLNANGYDTFFATDALSSISEARKHNPDLIILDLGLPAGDGYIVMERLKTHAALATIPIVVVSVREIRANEGRAIKAGAKAYLHKSANNSELLAVVRKALGEPEQPGDAAVYKL